MRSPLLSGVWAQVHHRAKVLTCKRRGQLLVGALALLLPMPQL